MLIKNQGSSIGLVAVEGDCSFRQQAWHICRLREPSISIGTRKKIGSARLPPISRGAPASPTPHAVSQYRFETCSIWSSACLDPHLSYFRYKWTEVTLTHTHNLTYGYLPLASHQILRRSTLPVEALSRLEHLCCRIYFPIQPVSTGDVSLLIATNATFSSI